MRIEAYRDEIHPESVFSSSAEDASSRWDEADWVTYLRQHERCPDEPSAAAEACSRHTRAPEPPRPAETTGDGRPEDADTQSLLTDIAMDCPGGVCPRPRSAPAVQQQPSAVGGPLGETLRRYLTDDAFILRASDYDGSVKEARLAQDLERSDYCTWRTLRVNASPQNLLRTTRRTLNRILDAQLHPDINCALYAIVVVQRSPNSGRWTIGTLDYHDRSRYLGWLAEARRRGQRWLCVFLIVSGLTDGASHSVALMVDAHHNVGVAFDPHGAAAPPAYPAGGSRGQTLGTLHDLVTHGGVGAMLFPGAIVRWQEPYRGSRVNEGLQTWIEAGATKAQPWWCVGREELCKPCREERETVTRRDANGMCMTLTLLTWTLCFRFQFWDMPRVAVAAREVMEDFLRTHGGQKNFADPGWRVRARAVLRRRVVAWVLKLHHAAASTSRTLTLKVITGDFHASVRDERAPCGAVGQGEVPCDGTRAGAGAPYCLEHMRRFFGRRRERRRVGVRSGREYSAANQ